MKLNKVKKLELINLLIAKPSVLYGAEQENIIKLLDYVFNTKILPSEDPRFNNAYEDSKQHLVNNNDWELEYTFLTRFDILKEDYLFKLIEYILEPNFQASEQERLDLVDELNEFLHKQDLSIEMSDFNEDDLPVFEFLNYNPTNKYPAGVIQNKTLFYTARTEELLDEFISVKKDVFILDPSSYSYWNDYSLQSRFDLLYIDFDGNLECFGEVKIITNNSSNHSNPDNSFKNFHTILPETFNELDESYCSLGQDLDYYNKLKNKFKQKFRSILFALRDCAFFTEIEDTFEKEYYFKNSLIRNNIAERILREVRHEINGRSRADMYKFTYLFTPNFSSSNNGIPIKLNFENISEVPNRIFAIIGKNGVGKTQFVSQLANSLIKDDNSYFEGPTPLFSKIISLSYSPFDNYKPNKPSEHIEHISFNLRDEKGGLSDDHGRAIKFGKSRKRIQELERVEDWKKVLSDFLPSNYINEIFPVIDWDFGEPPVVNVQKLNLIRKELSSGQRVLLEGFTNIIAHIRYDSLLLFDEPETHLHPNAIAQLMNTIYSLVTRFESFCIITTHSPIIIRELFSRNVYIFDRFEDNLSIRKIGLESFGANLSDITEEIFGTSEIPKHYQSLIKSLKREGKSLNQIINSIKSEDIPVSLNLHLFIRSLFQE